MYAIRSYYVMVNGSTGSIQTMIKYVSIISSLPILIQRNAHKSVLASCMLFNVDTIIMDDVYDDELQAFRFDEGKIIDLINQNEISAVLITSVDYFGRTVDMHRISQACKKKNILMLCDEAHGAHFKVSSSLPQSSLKYADICAHSPHKTLSALTQCSYMHISNKIDTEKITSLIHSLQTSSPSFLLMKSMDRNNFV